MRKETRQSKHQLCRTGKTRIAKKKIKAQKNFQNQQNNLAPWLSHGGGGGAGTGIAGGGGKPGGPGGCTHAHPVVSTQLKARDATSNFRNVFIQLPFVR
jgi:hypothetical protein